MPDINATCQFEPGYLKQLRTGELKKKAELAEKLLRNCKCCPHQCTINRYESRDGFCVSGHLPIVSSYTKHFGEEPGLSGTNGAGNIFFGNCNLRCVYCQNFEISQNPKREILNICSINRVAEIMIELQGEGCHNIGLVSPSHFIPQIIQAVYIAANFGLKIPVIYNSNGYDSVSSLRLLEGIVDIYLPDFKYGCNEYALNYSMIKNYYDTATLALKEMYRQVGDNLTYINDIVVRGLIIRHLVLPNQLSDTENVFKFISEELSSKITVSLMSQYYPSHLACEEILLSRVVSQSEYAKAVELLDKYNLNNGWVQELESNSYYRPHFNKDRTDPFFNAK